MTSPVEKIFLHQQVATLNDIVRSQVSNGAYSTWGTDRQGLSLMGANWFRCHHGAVAGLADYLLRARGEAGVGECF